MTLVSEQPVRAIEVGRTYHLLTTPIMPVFVDPSPRALRETHLHYGEPFIPRRLHGEWVYGDAFVSGVSGYIRERSLSERSFSPSHRVIAAVAHVYPEPNAPSPVMGLPIHARLEILGRRGEYLMTKGGWLRNEDARLLEDPVDDWVAICELFLGVKYVWGGRSRDGLDCSGLIGNGLLAVGIPSPHRSNLMQERIGRAIDPEQDGYRRGDLVFWDGHVGVMLDDERLLHATGKPFHRTVVELLDEVIARRRADGKGEVTAAKRL